MPTCADHTRASVSQPRGPEKTAPLIGIKSAVRLYASRRRDAEKEPDVFYLRVSCNSPPARSVIIFFFFDLERDRDRKREKDAF